MTLLFWNPTIPVTPLIKPNYSYLCICLAAHQTRDRQRLGTRPTHLWICDIAQHRAKQTGGFRMTLGPLSFSHQVNCNIINYEEELEKERN